MGKAEHQLVEPERVKLTPRERKRLRWLFGYGRPVHVGSLTGLDMPLLLGGLVENQSRGQTAGAVLAVTPAGLLYLNEERLKQVAALAVHSSLGARLGAHLRSKGMMTWEGASFLNPSMGLDREWSEVRPDVFACRKSLRASGAHPEIYEVKVSRADFFSDLAKPAKRAGYIDLAEAFYYACPEGLIQREEVPPGVGLVHESASGVFRVVKKAKRKRGFVIVPDTLMCLVLRRASGQDDEHGDADSAS